MKSFYVNSVFIEAFCDNTLKQKLQFFYNYNAVINQISQQIKKDNNIARFLNLDDYFINLFASNKGSIDSDIIIEWFQTYGNQKLNNINRVSIYNKIKYCLNMNKNKCYHEERLISVVILFEILATRLGEGLLQHDKPLRNTVHYKIIEMSSTKDKPHVIQYFSKFEAGKKYILIENNIKYRKRLLLSYLRCSGRLLTIQKIVKENRRLILQRKRLAEKRVTIFLWSCLFIEIVVMYIIMVLFLKYGPKATTSKIYECRL